MWCGRDLRRSAPPRIFYHSYALLSIYLVLSTANNCLQSTNSSVYPDGHASSTGKFLVAESDGLHRVRVHDTLKRKGFMSTRTNYYHNSTATFQQAKLIISGDISPNPGPTNSKIYDRTASSSPSSTGSKPNSARHNEVRISHLNIRSLKCREHYLLLKDFIASKDIDIFTLSETWLNENVLDYEIQIPGFNIHRLDRSHKPGGGVCVYVKEQFKVQSLADLSGIFPSGLHQLWLKIQIRNLRSFLVCTVYRPPHSSLSLTFEEELNNSLISALSHNKPVFILGDLNCNLLNPTDSGSTALKAFCSLFNLTQLISKPTRVTQSTKSLLDVLITSNDQLVIKSGVFQSSISDHDVVYANLRLKNNRRKPIYITSRSFKNYNRTVFQESLSFVPWSTVLSIFEDLDDKLFAFDCLFNDVLDDFAPIKTFKSRGRSNPFITPEIKSLMKTRDYWRALARKTDDLLAWSAYKNFKKEVKREIKIAEMEFVQEQIKNNLNNSNCLWKTIRMCIPSKSCSQHKSFSKDDKAVANEFNQFFSNVGQNANKSIQSLIFKADDFNPTEFVPLNHPISEQFHFRTVTANEVQAILMSIPSNKSPGHDKIPIKVYKDCLSSILPSITDLINTSLSSSVFPTAWKIAEVVPIPKTDDYELANNNRPISLLPVLSKVCERVVHKQVDSYLIFKDRLASTQSGNKRHHSTETSIIHSNDFILNAMDNKKLTASVFLDMSKAFDSLNHDLLIKKLRHIGLSSQVILWFQSYLSFRYQRVRINSSLSDLLPVSTGVPQGSILGPLLFSVYVNDLPLSLKKCEVDSYVDDTKMYLSFNVKDKDISITDLQQDLTSIRNWCFNNSLLINPDKTKLIVFGTKQMLSRLDDFKLSLLGKELTPCDSVRDLGVYVDSQLSYDKHVSKTVSSCVSRLCQINRVKHVFDKRTLKLVINALVFSRLFYCSSVWSNTAKKNVDKLQLVQNFAARIVANKRKYEHVTPILRSLNWLPVRDQLYFRDAVLAFKCMSGLAPVYLSDKLITRSTVSKRELETRNSQMLNIPLFRTATGQKTFYYRTVNIWNNLNNDIKLCIDVNSFRNKLRGVLLDKFKREE